MLEALSFKSSLFLIYVHSLSDQAELGQRLVSGVHTFARRHLGDVAGADLQVSGERPEAADLLDLGLHGVLEGIVLHAMTPLTQT